MHMPDSICFLCLGSVENCLELRGTDDIDSDNLFQPCAYNIYILFVLKDKFLQVWEMGNWECFSRRFGLCSDDAYNQV